MKERQLREVDPIIINKCFLRLKRPRIKRVVKGEGVHLVRNGILSQVAAIAHSITTTITVKILLFRRPMLHPIVEERPMVPYRLFRHQVYTAIVNFENQQTQSRQFRPKKSVETNLRPVVEGRLLTRV